MGLYVARSIAARAGLLQRPAPRHASAVASPRSGSKRASPGRTLLTPKWTALLSRAAGDDASAARFATAASSAEAWPKMAVTQLRDDELLIAGLPRRPLCRLAGGGALPLDIVRQHALSQRRASCPCAF